LAINGSLFPTPVTTTLPLNAKIRATQEVRKKSSSKKFTRFKNSLVLHFGRTPVAILLIFLAKFNFFRILELVQNKGINLIK